MKRFTTYLVIVVSAVAAFASIAQAGTSSPATRALQIRGQGMNALCQSPTLSRESYIAVCGTKGASQQPTRAELQAYQIRGAGMDALVSSQPSSSVVKALQIRGAGMDALCSSPTLSRQGYVAVCGTKGASQQPTRAELQAMQIRGQALDQVIPVPVATISSDGFGWGDFSIGAASMLGLVLLAGGIGAGVHFSRRHAVRPRTVS